MAGPSRALVDNSLNQVRSQPSGGGGGGRWRPKRGPSRVGWGVCVCGGGGGVLL